jgi:hypothetical protein
VSSLRWLSAPERAAVRLEPGTVPRGTLWMDGLNAVTDVDLEILGWHSGEEFWTECRQ